MKIAIASDHGGYLVKEKLKEYYGDRIDFIDVGTHSEDSCDYPNVASEAVKEVLSNRVELLILLCGTGIGMSMAANKFQGIRAALLYDDFSALMAREHNNANVIVFGARNMSFEDIVKRIDIFLEAKFLDGRYQRRNDMLDNL